MSIRHPFGSGNRTIPRRAGWWDGHYDRAHLAPHHMFWGRISLSGSASVHGLTSPTSTRLPVPNGRRWASERAASKRPAHNRYRTASTTRYIARFGHKTRMICPLTPPGREAEAVPAAPHTTAPVLDPGPTGYADGDLRSRCFWGPWPCSGRRLACCPPPSAMRLGTPNPLR